LAAITFALVNLFSFRIRLYLGKRRNQILSLFGGIIAAYVFVDLLPSLQLSNEYFKQLATPVYEDSIFLIVFAGFLLFVSLEFLAVNSRQQSNQANNAKIEQIQARKRVYLVHFWALAFLDFVLSFTLIFEYQTSIVSGLLFTFAVSLHLFISENSMVENYGVAQTKDGRYLAAVIPIIGWVTSVIFPERITEAYVLLAFISGSILYIAIKDEIPTIGRRRSYLLFLLGALLYTLLLIGHALLQ
jgi:zinc transporter ZupT